jgi:hypothetical protein
VNTQNDNLNAQDSLNNYFSNSPVIIYKTKGDYNDKVPVLMNMSRTKIVSYPSVEDLRKDGRLLLPVELAEGFLLDRKGISQNTGFLKITYEEYVKNIPSMQQMMGMIKDPDPFIEMYDCGNRSDYKNLEEELNNILLKQEFNKLKKII